MSLLHHGWRPQWVHPLKTDVFDKQRLLRMFFRYTQPSLNVQDPQCCHYMKFALKMACGCDDVAHRSQHLPQVQVAKFKMRMSEE